jgi:chromatin remodeling complex protein RSC6
MATIEDLSARVTTLEEENKKLRGDFKKMQKLLKKLTKEPEDPDKPKKLSGFAKPMKLSEALTTFLNVSSDTMMARTDVTKEINKYVKENNLQNPENKREITLDAKLRSIIVPEGNETITFFNLQRYMSPHYIKEEAPEEKEAPPPTPAATTDTPQKEEGKKVKKIVKKVVAKK